jgi:hypothetical protein
MTVVGPEVRRGVYMDTLNVVSTPKPTASEY